MLDVNDSVGEGYAAYHSHLVFTLVKLHVGLGLSGVLLRGHLLLAKQVEYLSNVLVEEVRVSDKLLELKYSIKETSSNLTGHLSVNILNREVNSVTNELNLFGAVLDGFKLLEVNFGEANLLNGGGLLLRSSLSHVSRSHSSGEVVSVHDGSGLRLSSTLTTTLALVVTAILASSSTLVSTSLLVSTLSGATSTSLEVSSVVSILSLLATHVASVLLTTNVLHHGVLLGSLVLTVSEPVEHLSLLASVFLILKLLLGNPEVDTDGSVRERSGLVQVLNCRLSVVNIFVENETLLVRRVCDMGVSAELNRYNGGDSLVEGGSVDAELSNLASCGEVNCDVFSVSSSHGVNSVTFKCISSGLSDNLARCITFINGDGSSHRFANNSDSRDSGLVFQLKDEITGEGILFVSSHQSLFEIGSRSRLLSHRSSLSLSVSIEGVNLVLVITRNVRARDELTFSVFSKVFEQLFELFFSDMRRNVLNEEVRVESLG